MVLKTFIKVLKIGIGAVIAIFIAQALHLQYATSAGIVLLLTIQNTKKETVIVAGKRILAYVMALGIAYVSFHFVGYEVFGYGVFLLIFVGACHLISFEEAIPMNAVLISHFLMEKTMGSMLVNETLLLLIGAGLGTLLNLFIISNEKEIIERQKLIEEDLSMILFRMSKYIGLEDKSDYTGSCFQDLELHIEEGIDEAYEGWNNQLLSNEKYYMRYMEMRKRQCQVLQQIYRNIRLMRSVPTQVAAIGTFISDIALTFGETNNAVTLLEKEHNLIESYQQSPMPDDRMEFEDRAILFMILKDLELFLHIKEEFAKSMTEEEKKRFWKQ